jgi:ABC-2 type transport system ATP-binding protein
MSAVTVDHLSRRYGWLEALRDVSFEVATGQTVALLGPNGAGKSTTMELLEGYQAPSGGTAWVLGVEPRRAGRAWRARIGLVLQSTSLDLQLTVREALAVHAGLFPDPRPVGEVLELIDLADEAGTRVGQLSGGQRRRVDVGLGIVGRPELLFLDEPTTGLDPEARRQAWTAVEGLTAAGTTVLLTTHYLEGAQQLADRVLVLARGRLLADARPDELRRRSAPTSIRYPLPPGAPTGDLPGLGPLFAGQVRYQLLLLLRSPRAVWARVLLPVMLLVLTNLRQAQVAADALAGRGGARRDPHRLPDPRQRAGRPEAGVLKRWRATPLPRWCYLAGRLCATVLLGLASGAVTVLVGVLAYHARLGAGAALGLAVVLGLAALAWASVGTALTAFIPTAESAQPLLAFSYFPVMLLSGALGVIGGAPGWLAGVLRWLPGQPTSTPPPAPCRPPAGCRSCPAVTWPCWPPGRWPGCWPPCGCSAGRLSRPEGGARPGPPRGPDPGPGRAWPAGSGRRGGCGAR